MAYRDELEAARQQIDSLEKSLAEEKERYSELEKREYYLRNESRTEEKKWMKAAITGCIAMLAIGIAIGTNFSCAGPQKEEEPPPDPNRKALVFGESQAIRVGDRERGTFSLEQSMVVKIEATAQMEEELCTGDIRVYSTVSQGSTINEGAGVLFAELPPGNYSVGVVSTSRCGNSPGAINLRVTRYTQYEPTPSGLGNSIMSSFRD